LRTQTPEEVVDLQLVWCGLSVLQGRGETVPACAEGAPELLEVDRVNLALFRLRPLLKELRGIHSELKRMNDIREVELAHTGLYIKPPVADTRGDEPEITYTDEERDYYRELSEEIGRIAKKEE
jgi:hypothetical protein